MTGTWRRAVVWIVIQLLPLLLGITATPLWARYSSPREQATLALLLSGQIIASAALRSWLLCDLESYTFVLFSSFLTLLLAIIASNHSLQVWAICCVASAGWYTALFLTTRSICIAKNPWIDFALTTVAGMLIGTQIAPRLL